MLKKIILAIFSIASVNAWCEDIDVAEQVKYKEEILATLKNEIQQIDSEMLRCEKSKNGWTAATVIGGIGVVATGAAAIVTAVKINQTKESKQSKDVQK